MNPLPRCMAVQLSDLALDSAKPFETMRHQKITGKRTYSDFPGNGAAVILNEIGRSALSLACCVYSVPLHATYIPKLHIWLFLFFILLFISPFIFIHLLVAGSCWDIGLNRSHPNSCQKKEYKKKTKSCFIYYVQSDGPVSPWCRNGFLFHTQSFIFDNQMFFIILCMFLMLFCIYTLYLFPYL